MRVMDRGEELHGTSAREQSTNTIKVWDPLVRIFHWSLVVAFATAFLVTDSARIHEGAGYVVLALLSIRLIWGVVGSKHARFTDFVKRPETVLAYLHALKTKHAKRYLGHNPAGGAMILALMGAIVIVAGSGWLSITDRFWGVGWVTDLHEFASYATLGLIGIHVTGVVVSSMMHRENLVLAMITGRKRP